MTLVPDVLSNPKRLNITAVQREEWIPQLLEFLEAHPLELTEWLYGRTEEKWPKGQKKWKKRHVRDAEKLILSKFGPGEISSQFLAILRSAAHLWSVSARTKVKLPRLLVQVAQDDNPFRFDYARAAADYDSWKDLLKTWIRILDIRRGEEIDNRDLLLCAFLVSAVIYGSVLGVSFLVAIVRSIAVKERATFAIGGRIYIESLLTVKEVIEAERRVWMPDPLSGLLWNELRAKDVDRLLALVNKDGIQTRASDEVIYGRIDRLIGQVLFQTNQEQGAGLSELRRCAREMGITLIKPVLVAYSNAEFTSNSLLRNDIRRLFPADDLYGDDSDLSGSEPSDSEGPPTSPSGLNPPNWHNPLVNAARSASPLMTLAQISGDKSEPNPMRLVADFGVSLLLSTSKSGKTMSERSVTEAVVLISRALGMNLENDELADLLPSERKEIYLKAINSEPKQTRLGLLQAILAFDTYLVAQNLNACPVPRSEFPWEPKSIFVDANLMTHQEYADFLEYLDKALPPRSSGALRRSSG